MDELGPCTYSACMKDNPKAAKERRQQERYPFTASVDATEPKTETRIKGRTSDISQQGCFIDSLNTFPPASAVKICISRGSKSFEGWARVMYPLAGMGMGVEFSNLPPEQLWTLEEWLRELRGEATMGIDAIIEAVSPAAHGTHELTDDQSVNGQTLEALRDLIVELIRTGALSQQKGSALLEKIRS